MTRRRPGRRPRRSVPCLVVWMLFLLGGGARAGEPSFDDYTEQGLQAYKDGRYDDSISALEAAYRIRPEPTLLFNLAQAHRRAGQAREALQNYERLLQEDPQTPLRDKAEHWIAELKAQLALPPRPPQAAPPPASVPAPPAAAVSPPAAVSPVPRPVLVATLPARNAPRPVYRRPWFWGIMAVAAAGVVAGITTGVVVGQRAPAGDLGTVGLTFTRPQ